METVKHPRLIKKYGNRKLYDLVESKYVTLKDVVGFVKAGEDIKIVNNKTNEDLTTQILWRAILEEDVEVSTISLGFLTKLIRQGDGVIGSLIKGLEQGA